MAPARRATRHGKTDAPYSGVPVRIDNANRDGRITDVLRLNP
ncbi:hypothetical protein MM3A0810R_3226 [Mycobacteroides abscessus 3A-0810-R]|nr:hypothetical protein MM3A0810R_3226 [Mycobacteroides abscessus 3A-0810-R]